MDGHDCWLLRNVKALSLYMTHVTMLVLCPELAQHRAGLTVITAGRRAPRYRTPMQGGLVSCSARMETECHGRGDAPLAAASAKRRTGSHTALVIHQTAEDQGRDGDHSGQNARSRPCTLKKTVMLSTIAAGRGPLDGLSPVQAFLLEPTPPWWPGKRRATTAADKEGGASGGRVRKENCDTCCFER